VEGLFFFVRGDADGFCCCCCCGRGVGQAATGMNGFSMNGVPPVSRMWISVWPHCFF